MHHIDADPDPMLHFDADPGSYTCWKVRNFSFTFIHQQGPGQLTLQYLSRQRHRLHNAQYFGQYIEIS
jgi:hypothetical protein